MPTIWTHIKFAEKLTETTAFAITDKQKPFLNLGAQGPDPFFYYNFWPWKKEKPVRKVGHALHYHCCGPFLLDLIQLGAKSTDQTKAYIIGFVTHHLLDLNAHPYIIYRSGEEPGKHENLEVHIDTLLMERDYGFRIWKVPVYKEFDIGPHLDSEIHSLLEQLISKHFPEITHDLPDHYVDRAYRDMRLARRVLYDPSGIKLKLLGRLVSPYIYTRHVP